MKEMIEPNSWSIFGFPSSSQGWISKRKDGTLEASTSHASLQKTFPAGTDHGDIIKWMASIWAKLEAP